MLATLRDLFCHQAFTDAALLNAIRRHETAARDQELRTLLHHILVAHRYWTQLSQGLPFSVEEETSEVELQVYGLISLYENPDAIIRILDMRQKASQTTSTPTPGTNP